MEASKFSELLLAEVGGFPEILLEVFGRMYSKMLEFT